MQMLLLAQTVIEMLFQLMIESHAHGSAGMKSTCRKLMYQKLGLVDKARPTGDAAFRAMIPLDTVTDPELRKFMTEPIATRWMGPDRHVQGYPIRHGNLYNMVRSSGGFGRSAG